MEKWLHGVGPRALNSLHLLTHSLITQAGLSVSPWNQAHQGPPSWDSHSSWGPDPIVSTHHVVMPAPGLSQPWVPCLYDASGNDTYWPIPSAGNMLRVHMLPLCPSLMMPGVTTMHRLGNWGQEKWQQLPDLRVHKWLQGQRTPVCVQAWLFPSWVTSASLSPPSLCHRQQSGLWCYLSCRKQARGRGRDPLQGCSKGKGDGAQNP